MSSVTPDPQATPPKPTPAAPPEPKPAAPAVSSAPPAPSPPPPASSAVSPPGPTSPSRRSRLASWIGLFVVAGVALVLIFFGFRWFTYRTSHSITDDAFVEAHIVNVAPEAVSGRVVRYLVEENDHVQEGQLLAEIDPIPYRDKVELARSKVEGAEAELRRQEANLARVNVVSASVMSEEVASPALKRAFTSL